MDVELAALDVRLQLLDDIPLTLEAYGKTIALDDGHLDVAGQMNPVKGRKTPGCCIVTPIADDMAL